MNLTRTRAIAKKEFIQIKRDPMSLAMAFLLPLVLLFIYGFAVTFDVDRITTVVYDMDKSSLSRELVNEFTQSHYFSVIAYLDRYEEIDSFLDRSKAKVALVIPHDFSKYVRTSGKATIEVILDGANSNTANIAQGYISAITLGYSQRIQGGMITPRIDSRSRVWYNTELKSRNFIIPGLIAVIMTVIIALLTSLTVAKEWDRGTMEQLISTPIKPAELVVGKLVPYFVVGFADTVFTILMSTELFMVPLRGSLTLLLVLSSIFLFGGLSMGILISISARNQTSASQMAMLSSFLPAFLLSGFIFSIFNMPLPLQIITYLIPARYFVTILKGIFLKGAPLSHLFWETMLLTVYAMAVFFLAVRKFKKRID
ncbi:MAG TPA: ABC transporter permease [Syntrophorhabdaceae bacterium]|nr:ABC transporter permease [Syntrophorhabdaceae bacterium]